MTLKVGEVGKTIRVSTSYDMSGYTELSIIFTLPDTSSVTKTTADGVTAPAVAVDDETLGELAASTYLEYDVEAGLLTEAGNWQLYAQYDDATPKTFFGDPAEFQVNPV